MRDNGWAIRLKGLDDRAKFKELARGDPLEQNNNLLQNFQVILRQNLERIEELEGEVQNESIGKIKILEVRGDFYQNYNSYYSFTSYGKSSPCK